MTDPDKLAINFADPSEVEDWLSDIIADSFDEDWRARDGAKAIVREMEEMGVTLATLRSPSRELVERILDKLDTGLPYPTEACAIVRSVAALRAPSEAGWRDIASALDCEEGVIVCDASKPNPAVGVARLLDGRWRGYNHEYGFECFYPTPTHWQPLPPPPAPAGERDRG